MALTVQFLGERLTDASSITNWSVNKLNGGGGGVWATLAISTDDYVQGGNSIYVTTPNNGNARTHSFVYDYNTAGGRALDFTPGGQDEGKLLWVWAKVLTLYPTGDAINTPGLAVGLCTTTPATLANYAWYAPYGQENYPGGWVRMAVDPRVLPTFSGASYDPSNITHVGVCSTILIAKPNDAVFVDAIDIGSGLRVFGDGDTEDAFTEIYNISESDTNAYGVMESLDANNTVYNLTGKIKIGDASGTNATSFTGTNSIIIMGSPQHINSTNSDFTISLDKDYQEILFEGNTTNPTDIQFGIAAGGGDDTRGRNGVIFLGNNDYDITMDFNDGEVDSLYFYGCTIRNFDANSASSTSFTQTWTASGNHGFFGSVMDECRTLNPDSGVTIRNSTFLNHNYLGGVVPQGALEFNSTTPPDDQIIDIKNCSFIANDYGISHTESGTYTYDNLSFSDNTFDIYFSGSPGGEDLVINATNGTLTTLTATTGDPGDTVTVTATVTLTITGFVDNSELYARNATDATIGIVERFNEESVVGDYEYVYNDPGSQIDLFIMKNQTSPTDTGYQWLSIRDFTLPNTAQTLQIFQIIERNSNIF